MERIDSFRGEHFWLSNFSPHEVLLVPHQPMFEPGWWAIPFKTVEHGFQAAKTFDPVEFAKICSAETPKQAKRLGRHVTLRSDWEHVKLSVMRDLVLSKFINNRELGRKLRATGNAELIEGNFWGDTFWGVCDDVGQNHLGKILMQVRREL